MTRRAAALPAPSAALPRARWLLGVVALAVAAMLAGAPAHAVDVLDDDGQQQSGGPEWGELTARQKAALAPLQGTWSTVGAQRKRKWIEIADRFPSMPAPEQQRVQQRMSEWAQMTPQERSRARSTFQQSRQVPAEERQARWQAYQALSEDERRALAQGQDGRQDGPRGGRRNAVDENQQKSNVVDDPAALRGNPGATTRRPLQPALPPAHQQSGLPKINAAPGFVDKATLLPQRGAQGAAIRPAPRASDPRDR